jgi:hypothetical protein
MGWTRLQSGWVKKYKEKLNTKNRWQSTGRKAEGRVDIYGYPICQEIASNHWQETLTPEPKICGRKIEEVRTQSWAVIP